MKTTNEATKAELERQIIEFKAIIITAIGCEKILFENLLIETEVDLKSGNHL